MKVRPAVIATLIRLQGILVVVCLCFAAACNHVSAPEKNSQDNTTDSAAISALFTKTKSNKDSAGFFIQQAREIADRNKSVKCKAYFLVCLGREYIYSGKLDSALIVAEQGLQLNFQPAELNNKGKFYNLKGNVEGYKKHVYSSIDYYLQAEKLFSAGNDSSSLAGVYNNIANAYFSLKDYETAERYATQAYALKKSVKESPAKANIITTYALALNKMQNNPQALIIVQEADSIATATNNMMAKLAATIGFAEIYKSSRNFDSAVYYYNKCIALSKSAGVKHFELVSRVGLLTLDEEKGNTSQIIATADSVLELAGSLHNTDILHTTKRIIGRAFAKKGDFAKGFRYLNESYSLYDSVAGIENQKNINELLVKYDSEKKEIEILKQKYLLAEQKAELKARQIYIILLTLGLAVLVLFFFYIRKLNKEKLKRFELEKQKTITDAFITGEERERRRISYEIHDGIAGMITAIVLKLQSRQDNKPEAISLLQQLHEDSRRIAYNLRPVDFDNQDLLQALATLCKSLSTPETDVSFTSNVKSLHTGNQKSALLYRVVQELINNALKYAACHSIFVRLDNAGQQIKIVVEDDGIGIRNDAAGNGLKSIKERVSTLGGTLSVTGEENEGTTIVINNVKA